MRRIGSSFVIAFSMYSRIPMPRVTWTDEAMRYAMCFFPLTGAVIGAAELFFFLLCSRLGAGSIFRSCVAVAVPLLLTGGIHLDGYLDTSDAVHSYGSREKRLEIMKDPHTGAFALISLSVYILLYLGAVSQLSADQAVLFPAIFVLERALSGLSVALFPLAKESGLAATFSHAAAKKAVAVTSCVYLFLSFLWLFYFGGMCGIFCMAAAFFSFWRYYRLSVREFGGITGDLAGYFLQACERDQMLVLALLTLII